jgi:hypothetical protein
MKQVNNTVCVPDCGESLAVGVVGHAYILTCIFGTYCITTHSVYTTTVTFDQRREYEVY